MRRQRPMMMETKTMTWARLMRKRRRMKMLRCRTKTMKKMMTKMKMNPRGVEDGVAVARVVVAAVEQGQRRAAAKAAAAAAVVVAGSPRLAEPCCFVAGVLHVFRKN